MPDELGVELEGTPPAPSDEASVTPEGAEPERKPPGAIPYERFKEVNDERKAEREARARAEQQAATLQARLEEMERRVEAAPDGSREEANAQAALQAEETRIRKLFGEDDTGKATYDALEEHFKHKLRSSGVATMEDVQRLVDDRVGGLSSRISSGYSAQSRISNMVQSGMLAQEDAAKVQGLLQQAVQDRRVQAAIAQDRTGGSGTINALLNGIVMHLTEQRQVELWKKPPPRPRPSSPLAPGNGTEPSESAPDFDPANSPFPELRELGKEKLKKRYELSVQRAKEARG